VETLKTPEKLIRVKIVAGLEKPWFFGIFLGFLGFNVHNAEHNI